MFSRYAGFAVKYCHVEVCSMTEPAHGVIEKIKSLRKPQKNGQTTGMGPRHHWRSWIMAIGAIFVK